MGLQIRPPGLAGRAEYEPRSIRSSETARFARRLLQAAALTVVLTALVTGAVIGALAVAAPGGDPDRPATFFLGRLKYGQNQGGDCGAVGKDLLKLVSNVLTLRVEEERRLFPTDADLFETPFLFMNGHYGFTLADRDIEALSAYFMHGGFMLASECCSNPEFPKAWRREFQRVFPGEKIKVLEYDHPIYRAFHKMEKIPCLHERRDVKLEGLFFQENLVAVLCGDGLCGAFSMNNTCNSGRGVGPEDGKKLALNVAVYATH